MKEDLKEEIRLTREKRKLELIELGKKIGASVPNRIKSAPTRKNTDWKGNPK